MSRLPPTPPANQSVYGPGGSPKTSVDISHRVRHQARRVQDEDDPQEQRSAAVLSVAEQSGFGRVGAGRVSSQPADAGQSGIAPPEAIDDLGGFVPGHRGIKPSTWMLLATGAVVAAIVWLADRQRQEVA